MVEHCSANAEAMGSNPVEIPNFFFGFICNCLNCNYPREDHIFISKSFHVLSEILQWNSAQIAEATRLYLFYEIKSYTKCSTRRFVVSSFLCVTSLLRSVVSCTNFLNFVVSSCYFVASFRRVVVSLFRFASRLVTSTFRFAYLTALALEGEEV